VQGAPYYCCYLACFGS